MQVSADENDLVGQPLTVPPVALLLENMIEGCQIIDFDFRYVYLNPSAQRQSKRDLSELVGKRMVEAYPGIDSTELFAVLGRCMRERVVCRFENEFVFPNGARGVFDLHIVPAPHGLFVFSIDISESRRLLAQIRQSQKVIAIGQLAAGAAHDLANLLTVVTGSSELLLERITQDEQSLNLARNISEAAERCADMVSQILAFRRQTNLQSKLIDLNKVIVNVKSVLQQLVGEGISVELQLAEIEGAVNLHPTKLEQVLFNLAVNARDAMPHGGRLNIKMEEQLATGQADTGHSEEPSRFAKIAVSDTGIGMSEEVLARIFEPFYSTKEEGMGAGLGLATVYSLIQQAGGSVTVESSPGNGASFFISLPIFD
jgi:signal transduction histidine kinase